MLKNHGNESEQMTVEISSEFHQRVHFDPDNFFKIWTAASVLFGQNTASSEYRSGIEQMEELRIHSIPRSLKSLNCEKKY